MAEKLNINKTPATLFVGVGGIGSDIVTRVAERCADGETKNIRFVAMDTNANDLRGVKNSKANIVPIQTSSTQSVLDYLKNDDDARNNWFPNNTTLYPKTVSEGAGQVRAISRLALNATIKTGEIAKLYKTIDDLFLKDGEDTKQALRVVVVSSACGGTGSGIAMIVGMLVREYLHKHYREKAAIIRGFLLLPGVMDTVIKTEVERRSLRRNGYATLKEINAFMIKASGFCGVRKELERYKDLHIDVPTTTNGVDRLENLPFDFCFLLDRVDQSSESMQTLEQYKEFAAQSLYEQNIGPMQRNAFSMEDNIIKEFADGDNLGRNRFGGIGAAILRYPYEDVADYIAYTRAMDRIGDGESAGDWQKYDKAFKLQLAEFKKKRAMTLDKEPTIDAVYMTELENDDQRFGNDIKGYLAADISNVADAVAEKLDTFVADLEAEIKRCFIEHPDISVLDAQIADIKRTKDYEGDPNTRNHANENLSTIRMYEAMVKKMAGNMAKARAKAVLNNGPAIAGDAKPYNLETLLKTPKGAMHPNAIRYVLYALKAKMSKSLAEEIEGDVQQATTGLQIFLPTANSTRFDVKCRYSKQEEKCIDDVVALEKLDPTIFDKMGGYKNLWEALNKHLPGYCNAVIAYRDAMLKQASYKVAVEYLEKLCAEFEKFFESFDSKVVGLEKKREEIVEKLRFRKGDSVYHVLGQQQYLNRLAVMCPEGSDGLLLPEALNGDIFEAVKKNAESETMAQYDPNGDYGREDIFDAVLLGYFRTSVRKDCDEFINMNIVKAIFTEQRFKAFFDANSMREDGDLVATPPISDDSRMEYLKNTIKMGSRLASSGIGCANFNEPRTVSVSAFNADLVKMRDIDVKKVLESMALSPVATDTVSKYDIRFFNALYNVTPDKMSRFKSPEKCREDDQYSEMAGIYFDDYHEYIKKLGPDSTKSACISLHIDKRWDSLTEMPEISMDAHYDEMVKIHSALIYGIAYSMIKKYQSSRYDVLKRVYALEDTQGEQTALIVSNNTECDEFYEVLDALYRDRASVAKIYEMVEERCRFDIESNRRYIESGFFKEAKIFKIGDGHKGPTSLFEIPLAYYNSLPRAKLDDNELSIMIDSVINVLETEINKYEQEVDRAPFLSTRLEEQFKLLVDNFQNDEYNVNEAMRKNTIISENKVINMVFRKISNKIKDLKTFNFAQKIDDLRALIQE